MTGPHPWPTDPLCLKATSLPFIRSPRQRSQATLREVFGRMSWRSCLEGLACRCRIGCLGLSFICNEGELTMKTILVPTQNNPAMKSTLETAVLLAQRTGAYVEGVPLWYGVPEFVVAEQASSFSIETYRSRRQ